MDKRLSIYVSSPDSYSDVLAVFLKGYRRYWSDCPYEFILTTNTKSYEGITCICNNKQNDTWVERTIAALPVIKSKYVMLMCDDIILSDNVDNSLIEQLLDYMDSHEIRYCNLGPTPKGSKIKSFPLLRSVNKQIPYAINLYLLRERNNASTRIYIQAQSTQIFNSMPNPFTFIYSMYIWQDIFRNRHHIFIIL